MFWGDDKALKPSGFEVYGVISPLSMSTSRMSRGSLWGSMVLAISVVGHFSSSENLVDFV